MTNCILVIRILDFTDISKMYPYKMCDQEIMCATVLEIDGDTYE